MLSDYFRCFMPRRFGYECLSFGTRLDLNCRRNPLMRSFMPYFDALFALKAHSILATKSRCFATCA
jgi:hypothetical protein